MSKNDPETVAAIAAWMHTWALRWSTERPDQPTGQALAALACDLESGDWGEHGVDRGVGSPTPETLEAALENFVAGFSARMKAAIPAGVGFVVLTFDLAGSRMGYGSNINRQGAASALRTAISRLENLS